MARDNTRAAGSRHHLGFAAALCHVFPHGARFAYTPARRSPAKRGRAMTQRSLLLVALLAAACGGPPPDGADDTSGELIPVPPGGGGSAYSYPGRTFIAQRIKVAA